MPVVDPNSPLGQNPKAKRYFLVVLILSIAIFYFINVKDMEQTNQASTVPPTPPDYALKIESNVDWRGYISGRTVEGLHNEIVDVDDDRRDCFTITKQSSAGFLKITIIDNNHPAYEGQSKETYAKYGSVTVCIK